MINKCFPGFRNPFDVWIDYLRPARYLLRVAGDPRLVSEHPAGSRGLKPVVICSLAMVCGPQGLPCGPQTTVRGRISLDCSLAAVCGPQGLPCGPQPTAREQNSVLSRCVRRTLLILIGLKMSQVHLLSLLGLLILLNQLKFLVSFLKLSLVCSYSKVCK